MNAVVARTICVRIKDKPQGFGFAVCRGVSDVLGL